MMGTDTIEIEKSIITPLPISPHHTIKHFPSILEKKETLETITDCKEVKPYLHFVGDNLYTQKIEQYHLQLQQLEKTINSISPDLDAYETLMERLTAKTLSGPALYCFANLCYLYWDKQLLSQTKSQELQATSQALKKRLEVLAKGKILYRKVGNPEHYFLADTTPYPESKNYKGSFFTCYPHFQTGKAGECEGVMVLENACEVTEPAVLMDCELYINTQRLLEQDRRILCDIQDLYAHLDQQTEHHANIIVNLRLAELFYNKGRMAAISLLQREQAAFYLKRALGKVTHYLWTHQQPALPDALIEEVYTWQAKMDRILFRQAQQQFFAEQASALIQRWYSLYQDPSITLTLKRFYETAKPTFSLFQHFPKVDLDDKKPLLTALMSGLSTHDYEDDDMLHQAMHDAISKACNPAAKDPDSLATIHKWILAIIQGFQQIQFDDEPAALAQVLAKKYNGRLIKIRTKSLERDTIQQKFYEQISTQCDMALQQLAALPQKIQESKDLPPSRKKSKLSTLLAKRKEALTAWYQTLQIQLQDETSQQKIQASNADFAKKWLAGACRQTEEQLGPPPCPFVLFGAGSFSREEISPCSDMDILLLVADTHAKSSIYFKLFLQLLQWRLADTPEGVLPIESETIGWILSYDWLGTPHDLISQHLASLPTDDSSSLWRPESFCVQWPKFIYGSIYHSASAEVLFTDYQQQLQQSLKPENDNPSLCPYQRLAPWALQKQIGEEARQVDLATSNIETNTSPVESKQDSALISRKTVNLKNVIYPLTNTALALGRSAGLLDITDTHSILTKLSVSYFVPPSFIQRLQQALTDLQSWRLRLHWDWLHHRKLTNLPLDEVLLWPDDKTNQLDIIKLPRGFYLDEIQTKRLDSIRSSVEIVIYRSLGAYVQQSKQVQMIPPSLHPRQFPSIPSQMDDKKGGKELKISFKPSESQSDPLVQQTSVIFNPFNAALNSALDKLQTLEQQRRRKKEKEQKEDISLSETAYRQQMALVRWLAEMMALYAEELSLVTTQHPAPKSVQENPLFHRHWEVYWAIPTHWRKIYIDTWRQLPHPPADQVMHLLITAPTQSGVRLRSHEEQQKWQQKTLPSLWLKKSQEMPDKKDKSELPSISVARNHSAQGKAMWRIHTYVLKPEVANQLFIEGHWKPKDPKIAGNHIVHPICLSKNKKPDFWVKVFPEQPGSELLVYFLDRLLGVFGTPMVELVKFHHGNKTSAAIISQAVEGFNLRTILRDNPQLMETLDFSSFLLTLIRVLLTNPEDDKDDDYFLVEQPNGSLGLMRIDNERAFYEASEQQGIFKIRQLKVKSIIYCLEQMRMPIDNHPSVQRVLDDILQLQPTALIKKLFQYAQNLHEAWKLLFSSTEVIQHFHCKTPGTSLPVMFTFNGLARELATRYALIHNAVVFNFSQKKKADQHLTGLSLLQRTQPNLALFYINAHRQFTPVLSEYDHKLSRKRFEKLVAHLYQQDIYGNFSSKTPPKNAIKTILHASSELSPELIQQIYDGNLYCPQQELAVLLHWQGAQLKRVLAGLKRRDRNSLTEFKELPLRCQQDIWRELKLKLQRGQFQKSQQLFLLEAIHNIPWMELDFTVFNKLLITNETLASILRGTEQHLRSLNISGCYALTSDILAVIAETCTNLEALYINLHPQWKKIRIGNFQNLNTLECNSLTSLIELSLGCLPNLQRLSIIDAKNLRRLANTGWGLFETYHWQLLHLRQLNIQGCDALHLVKLQLNRPDQLLCTGRKDGMDVHIEAWPQEGLLRQELSALNAFHDLSAQEQQEIWQTFLNKLEHDQLDSGQQRFYLKILTKIRWKFLDLSTLSPSVVTTSTLNTILEFSGQYLEHLDISGCVHLSSDVTKVISRHCPQLRFLQMNRQSNWSNLAIFNFLELIVLECNDATRLRQVNLQNLPKLQRLSFANATQLEEISGSSSTILGEPNNCYLPALRILNTLSCDAIRIFKIQAEYSFSWYSNKNIIINHTPTTLVTPPSGRVMTYDYMFKFLMIDDAHGNSLIKNYIDRWIDGYHHFDIMHTVKSYAHSHAGLDFASTTIKLRDKNFKLQIWYSVGRMDRFPTITSSYLRGASTFIIPFAKIQSDLSEFKKSIKKQVDYLKKEIISGNKKIILLGLESKPPSQRDVSATHISYAAGMALSKELDLAAYLECDGWDPGSQSISTTIHNIHTLFEEITLITAKSLHIDLNLIKSKRVIEDAKSFQTNLMKQLTTVQREKKEFSPDPHLTLDLEKSEVNANKAWILSTTLKPESRIGCINLNHNYLGDDGAWVIAQIIKSHPPSLTRILLMNNQIEVMGAKSLIQALRYNTTLVFLDLSGNPIPQDILRSIDRYLQRNREFQSTIYNFTDIETVKKSYHQNESASSSSASALSLASTQSELTSPISVTKPLTMTEEEKKSTSSAPRTQKQQNPSRLTSDLIAEHSRFLFQPLDQHQSSVNLLTETKMKHLLDEVYQLLDEIYPEGSPFRQDYLQEISKYAMRNDSDTRKSLSNLLTTLKESRAQRERQI